MNIEHFMEWFMNRLLPNCPPRSVIVLDNAKYQNSVFEKIPTKSSTKKFMMEWRTKRGVVYDSRSLKAELFLTVKAQNAKPTYLTDIKAAEFGFDLIRLPVGHCELNLIELVWAQVKGYAARNNKDCTMAGIEVCAREGIENVDSDRWASCVRHVITKVENHYREFDGLVEEAVEELVIRTKIQTVRTV
ncbi:uncharacterized protein [Oscarella lobularis]|uniref:uncharacterized protein n=1 Tax=Oscarella lobularis TaxID=121494 RepID=UPI0033141C8A